MDGILIFAGTTEGRLLAEHLLKQGKKVHICVATEYGEAVLLKHENLQIHQGRLNCDEMTALLGSRSWQMVVDATHPYAVEVSKNIKSACECTNKEYHRLLRAEEACLDDSHVIYADSMDDAIRFLNQTEGNLLFTTGSKDLPYYMEQITDRSRIYARILADGGMVDRLKKLGLSGKQIICMQGPFLAELNAAMLKQVQASYLITKDTGVTGGFPEKIEGARLAGAKVVVIRRPVEETGFSMEELLEKLGIVSTVPKQKITLLGIGMGSLRDMTIEAKAACQEADQILGASRMIEALRGFGKPCEPIYDADQIASYIKANPEKKKIVAAFSGDVGFYSGTKKLLKALEPLDLEIDLLPGISSVVSFASKLRISWEDMKLVSIHGRAQNVIGAVRSHEKVFSLAGYAESIRSLAIELIENGLESVTMSVGSQLSYPEEIILKGVPAQFQDYDQKGLCVVVIENPSAKDNVVTHGLSDGVFERGNAPMTKEEIRSISVSKLALTKHAVVYDIGAGTGSIGLECAMQAVEGRVYAIEKKTDALELLSKNKKNLGITNLEIISGEAPNAMYPLPIPTHAFVGGSSGNMKEIVELLLEKNPHVRIVINCIALDTVSEVMQLIKEIPFAYQEIVQVSVGKSKMIGNYHMMMGQNPVYIITLQRD